MSPEFARPERIDSIGEVAREVSIIADAAERAALARRFGLLGVERLEARFRLHRTASGIEAEGQVVAEVIQACAATAEPIAARVDEPVRLRFVDPQASEAEVELDAGDLDTLEIENGAVDLGEAAAETMALALDPFARIAGADEALRNAGVLSEDDTGPFAALAQLKERLDRSQE